MLAYLLGVSRTPDISSSRAVLPLRLFLGVTFVYAGLQKLTDPQFFSPTAPGFIGRQMSGYVRAGSPLSPVLTHLAIPHPTQFGALIAFCELWAGLAALLGLLTRAGALGGLAISVTLYLTATWSVHPYFLGADLPYAMCWLLLLLAGPGIYSLDEYFFGAALRGRMADALALNRSRRGRRAPVVPLPLSRDPVARASLVRGLGTAAAVIGVGGILGAIAKLLTPNTTFAGNAATLAPSAGPAGGTASSGAARGPILLGSVKGLPTNSAGQYTDPASGDPALLIHLQNGSFVAYDAVCTHAGCTVQYDPTQQQIVCPCHGAAFDPAHGAQVLAGPAPQPLATLQVKVDARGNAYALDSGATPRQPGAPQGNSGSGSGDEG